jgi:inorganic pyrophosphatase
MAMNVDVVIETPKGSSQKYDYVPDTPFFKMSKILPPGMVFPYDFGFIPKTKGEDGDPLDVIVISEFKSFPGVIIKCRIIGGITADQSAEKRSKKMIRNDRFLAVPRYSNIFQDVKKMGDLPKEITDQLEDFFIDYNKLEGKKFKAIGKIGPKEAQSLIEKHF